MGYQPFLIAPFGTGLDTDLEPWLLPQDAFTEIENGHIHHGYIEKRQGYRFFGDMVHGSDITAASGASPAVFTIASTANLGDGLTVSLHYLDGDTWSSLNGAKYTVTVLSATTFSLTTLAGVAVDGAPLGTYTASSGRLGSFSQVDSTSSLTTATTASPAVFDSAIGVVDGDIVILTGLTGGTWSILDNQWFTVANLSGTTFNLLNSSGIAVNGSGLGVYTGASGTVTLIKKLRMMGIFRYINADGTRELLISDTERIAIYNSASNLFEPLDLYDASGTLQTDTNVWACSDLDYMWVANWQNAGATNRVYITNGKFIDPTDTPGTDGIVYYDATRRGAPLTPNVVQFLPILSETGAATTRTLSGCKLIFSINYRLVCLHTFEYDSVAGTTTTFPQRARWCRGQNPDPAIDVGWTDTTPGKGGFVDAPTGEQIISARAIQDMIIVQFTDSVWTLRPLPNPALPFRWDKINDFRACDGKMATVNYDRYVVAVGQRGITGTDGVETRRVDDRIEDFVDDDINNDEFGKVFAARSFQNRRTWILYPKDTQETDNDEANAALIYDDESSAYSKYTFSREVSGKVVDLNVIGHGSVAKDFAAEDFVEANNLDIAAKDLNDETASSYFWSKGSELFLGGDRNGTVLELETEGSDGGESIIFKLEGAGWNPFKDQGVEAQLGYVDMYCDSDESTKFSVEFLKNDNENFYKTQGLDLLPDLTYKSSVANIIPNADPSTGFVVTSNSHGVAVGEKIYIYGVEGGDFYNNEEFEVDSVTENTLTIAKDITSDGSTITGVSQANPGVVTAVAHGFNNGDIIYITDVSGMIELNGNTYTVANKEDDTFELLGVDTSGFTAYTSGGYAFQDYTGGGHIVERKFYRTKVWKRAYAGGVGFVHQMKIRSEGINRPLKIHGLVLWFRPRGRRMLG